MKSIPLSKRLYEVNNGKGYTLDLKLTKNEVEKLKSFIKEHSLDTIKEECPDLIEKYRDRPLHLYHELSNPDNHARIWNKNNRIFPMKYTSQIKKFPFFQQLEEEFGGVLITNEEELYPEEIYWRFVRPKEPKDIGPLHADKWFWDLGHGKMPQGYFRLKIWISIFCNEGGNGLKVVPNSHCESYPYGQEERGGFLKPVFDGSQFDLDIVNLNSTPGDTVIFHDKLLHGGCLNEGKDSRFSMEFTMLIKE